MRASARSRCARRRSASPGRAPQAHQALRGGARSSAGERHVGAQSAKGLQFTFGGGHGPGPLPRSQYAEMRGHESDDRTRLAVTDNQHSTRARPPEGGRSLLGFALRLGGTAAGATLRPAVAVVAAGRRVEHDVRDRVGRRLGEAVLAGVDSVLASELAGGAIDRMVASPLAERALAGALEGPLVDALARDVVRHAVVERLMDPLLSAEVLEAVLERADHAKVPQRLTERLLADGVVESAVARVLDGPELERVAAAALDSPAAERLVVRVIESRLLDEAVVRLCKARTCGCSSTRSPAVRP